MKSLGLRAFGFFVVLALATLACAVPGVDSLLNPMPADDFSDSSSGWGTGTDASSSVEYVDGGLKMSVYQTFYVTWSTPNTDVYENVHIEVSAVSSGSDPQSFYGIVCNEQGSTSSFYYVGVTPEGYYAFIKSAVALDDVYLKEGNSDAIAAAASGSMRIGLDCGNGSLVLYVNGQQIDSVADATYTSGVVGIFAASDDLENGAVVTFDDFAMSKLGQ
ncbi:MAG: hypothetical protein HY863_01670 [Chloroflexi bacterium]|nr:hypothetical protein [Chloroflexota bacterium]